MPTAEVIERYLDVPSRAGAGAVTVAPRKVLAMSAGGSTMVRSNNPKGYLIPDVGWFVATSAVDGTVRPDTMTIVIADTGIVINISASEQIAEHLFPALLGAKLGSVITTHPSHDHITDAGFGALFGSYGALAGVIGSGPLLTPAAEAPGLIVDLLKDAPALAGVQTHEIGPAPESSASPSQKLSADAPVAEIATRIAEISALNDGELARVFRVARETFQRWRTGELTNPNVANRRRLGLLLRLLDDVAGRDVRADQWLRNVSDIEDLTPYELLERGRLDDVEYLAAHLPAGSRPQLAIAPDGSPVTRADARPAFAPRRNEPLADLSPDGEEGWEEVEAEAIDDDE
jgi:hypothetical protein